MNGLDAPERLRGVVGSYPALQLLVLHGSRARSEAHEWSDWDLAYLAVPELDRHLRRVHEHLPGGRLGVASGKRGRVHEAAPPTYEPC